jgi:hypothetical protein
MLGTVCSARAHCILDPIAIAGLIALTAPAPAQEQAPLLNPPASVVNEQTVPREVACIKGQIDQLDERAGVLCQPAGQQRDDLHEVVLRRFDAFVILATLAIAAAGSFTLGRLRSRRGI